MSMDVIQTFNIEDRFMQVIEVLIRAQRAFFHTSGVPSITCSVEILFREHHT